MPAEVAELIIKIKEGNTEAGGQETLPSSKQGTSFIEENTQPSQSVKRNIVKRESRNPENYCLFL